MSVARSLRSESSVRSRIASAMATAWAWCTDMSRANPASGDESRGVAESPAPSLPHPATATSASDATTNASQRFICKSLDRLAHATAAGHTELGRLWSLFVEGDELWEPRVVDRVEPELHTPRGGDHRLGQTGIRR